MSTELFDIKDEIKNYFETIVDDYIENGEHDLKEPINGLKTNKDLLKKLAYEDEILHVLLKQKELNEKLKSNPANKEAISDCIKIINDEINQSQKDYIAYVKNNPPAAVPKPKTK